MHTVFFNQIEGADISNPYSEARIFMSGVSDYAVAKDIAINLEEERFVAHAWVEAE